MAVAVPLSDKMNVDGLIVFYREDMRVMFENHLPYLKANNRSSLVTIEARDAHKYEFDLTGLLLHYSLPMHLHWLVMRLNGMNSPLDFTADITALYVPDPTVVERLQSTQNTLHTLV